MPTILSLNVTNLIVISVFLILIGFSIIYLFIVYEKNPCGDCVSAKQCNAFSKKKILKAYMKACKREKKKMKN